MDVQDAEVVQGCSPMSMSIEGCDFGVKSLVVRINDIHPTIKIALDALDAVPDYRLLVEHLVVEQSFSSNHAPASNAHFRQVAAEATSIAEVRTVLTRLSSNLQSFALFRTSIDPLHSSLESQRVLKQLYFPNLQFFVVYGSFDTTARFGLELSSSFAPCLRRLQLPSDMLSCRLSYTIRSAFPSPDHLDIHPLRPGYTIYQRDALFKIGEYLGVFRAACAASQAGCRTPFPRAKEGFLHVHVYVDPTSKYRLQEVARFREAAEERLAEGAKERWRLYVVERADEPSLCEMAQWWTSSVQATES